MRRYLAFAGAWCRLVDRQRPDDAAVQRIVDVAKRFRPWCAVRHHRLANEDLI